MRIREARDSDAAALIDLIGAVFAEYAHCVLDVDGEMPELRRIASDFTEHDGRFWVAESEHGGLRGCIGVTPAREHGGVELKKLYVASSARRTGLGGRLLELVLEDAARRGARFIDLWSDTRFETAHGFYERRGFLRNGVTRELGDLSGTVEYYFRRAL
jgi:N-acetylglutamate synthase-like GNAT family acetyltransferase